jgi:hypothetical protein
MTHKFIYLFLFLCVFAPTLDSGPCYEFETITLFLSVFAALSTLTGLPISCWSLPSLLIPLLPVPLFLVLAFPFLLSCCWLSLSLFFYLYLFISLYFSLYLSISLFLSLFFHLSIYRSLFPHPAPHTPQVHLERALDKDLSLAIYAHPNEAICGGKKAAARKLSAGAVAPLYIAAPTHAQVQYDTKESLRWIRMIVFPRKKASHFIHFLSHRQIETYVWSEYQKNCFRVTFLFFSYLRHHLNIMFGLLARARSHAHSFPRASSRATRCAAHCSSTPRRRNRVRSRSP